MTTPATLDAHNQARLEGKRLDRNGNVLVRTPDGWRRETEMTAPEAIAAELPSTTIAEVRERLEVGEPESFIRADAVARARGLPGLDHRELTARKPIEIPSPAQHEAYLGPILEEGLRRYHEQLAKDAPQAEAHAACPGVVPSPEDPSIPMSDNEVRAVCDSIKQFREVEVVSRVRICEPKATP